MKYDEVENTVEYLKHIDEVEAIVKKEMNGRSGLGTCHIYWNLKKKYLKELYDIDWHSPAELNPNILFD